MADQELQKPSPPAPVQEGPSVATGPAVSQPHGNDAAQANLTSAAGPGQDPATAGDAGLANYEAALGEFLGGPLYKALADQLRYSALSADAHKGAEAALDGLLGAFGDIDGVTADPKALDALGTLLKDKLDPVVDKWMEKHGKGLSSALTGWVGAHPRTIVLTALLAAAGAVLANLTIPKIKQKFNLGKGLSAEIEAKLGRIRALSLQSVRAKLSYESGPLLAAVSATHDETGDAATASVGYKGEGKSVNADATFDGKGLKLIGLKGVVDTGIGQLSGSVSNSRDAGTIAGVSLQSVDGNTTNTQDYRYDATSGAFTVGIGSIYKDSGLTVERKTSMGSDGSSAFSQSMSGSQTSGGATTSASLGFSHESKKTPFGMTDVDKATLGFSYSRADLVAKLDAALASDGSSSLSGSVKKTSGEQSFGADLSFHGDTKLFEVGGFYGFKSEREFKTFLLDYRYKSGIDQNRFGVLVEQELKGTYLRWQSGLTWGGVDSAKLDSTVQGARFVDDNTAIIAGAHYTKDFGTGQNKLNPQVGVQYKGIPVIAEYDTQKRGLTLSITIPFGR